MFIYNLWFSYAYLLYRHTHYLIDWLHHSEFQTFMQPLCIYFLFKISTLKIWSTFDYCGHMAGSIKSCFLRPPPHVAVLLTFGSIVGHLLHVLYALLIISLGNFFEDKNFKAFLDVYRTLRIFIACNCAID